MISSNQTYSVKCDNCGILFTSPRLRNLCFCSEKCKWEAEKLKAEKARQLIYNHFLKLYNPSSIEEKIRDEMFTGEILDEIFDEYIDQGSLRKTLIGLGAVTKEFKLDLKKIHAIVILKKFEYKERIKEGYSGKWSMEKIGSFPKPPEIMSY